MRVAVVTPYFKEPLEVLRRCHDSVARQTWGQDGGQVTHFMVADGHSRPELDAWPVRHLPMPWNHGDYGDTPRVTGALSAATQGYDAIAFLDADNWYEPDHIEALVARQRETGAHVVTATRNLLRQDGSLLGVCAASDGVGFCDMNCYLITRPAFGGIGAFAFKDPRSAIVDDKILWSILKGSNAVFAHVAGPTVNYVTMWAISYLERGEEPPPGARVMLPVEGEPYPRMFDYREAQRRHELAAAGAGA
jgi:hypothetical protein